MCTHRLRRCLKLKLFSGFLGLVLLSSVSLALSRVTAFF